MFRRTLGLIGLGLCLGASSVWADDASNAALKAELELLRAKMEKIESQMASGSSISTADKAGSFIQLPSGLAGLQMSGLADISYVYNFAAVDPGVTGRTTSRGRFYDNEPNGFTPHLFELAFEKPLSEEDLIGFRADLQYGDDVALTKSAGLGLAGEDFDLQQAYVALRAPVGEGIDFKIGKFVTLIGAEVAESPANWNFSRSFLYSFAEPATHTGVLASYNVVPGLVSIAGGVVNGWDIVDDNNKAKSLLGGVTLTPIEGVTLIANAITGAEQISNSRDNRTLFDFVGIWQATDKLAFMANYDFGHEDAGRVTAFEAKEWAGLALYTKYDVTDKWSLAGRWEWFDDKDNFRTGFTGWDGGTPTDIDFIAWTLTSQWKLRDHVLARLEYRHDSADEHIFYDGSQGFSGFQDTIATEVIYHF